MDYQMTEQERVSFLKFAADFPEDVRKGLAIFCDYVVGRAVIPYKIKNREFVVRVADTAAFSITLTFHGGAYRGWASAEGNIDDTGAWTKNSPWRPYLF